MRSTNFRTPDLGTKSVAGELEEGRDLLSIIFNDFVGRCGNPQSVWLFGAFWTLLTRKKRRYCGFSRKKEWRRRLFAKKEIDIVARGRKRRRRKRPFYSTSFFSASASSFLSQKTVKKEPKIDFWSKIFLISIMLTSAFANFYFWKLKIVLRTKMILWFILRTLPPPFFSLQVFFCLFLLLFLLPPERPIVSITTSFFTRFFLLKKKEKSGKLLWEEGEKIYAATGPTATTTTTKILSPPSFFRPPPRGLETFSGDFPSVSRTQKGRK